jgi:hypothetical protein
MLFGVPGLKRTLNAFAVSILVSAMLVSCSNYNSAGNRQGKSGLKFRAFVSNPLHQTSSGVIIPDLEIVDASKDVQSPFGVSLSGALPDAGMMVLSPKKDKTLVVSPSSNRFAVVDNATESASGSLGLPGPTESLFVWTDDTTAFIAVPNAAVAGQVPGAVERVDISSGAMTAAIPVPGAHYLVPSPSGNQILVISDSADAVTLLSPSLISSGNPLTAISGSFDKPVWAVFSADGATAYIMNCGKECGGAADASIVPLDLSTLTTSAAIPVANGGVVGGATIGVLSNTTIHPTIYIAGTPPGTACGSGTAAQNCGVLSVFDTTSKSVTATALIPDGYHNRIQMGANSQLFVGSHTCTNVTTTSEVRGCLAIFDSVQSTVTVPPDNGDVTGIEPIPNRNQVYVCEGGALRIYDTTTDKLQTTQVNIVGQAIDVKVVDF